MIRRLLLLLLLTLPLAACAQPSATPVEGEDYLRIEGGKPWQPLAGKIEVVEIFAYWCPHCADFEPKVEAWQAKQRKDVRFSYLTAAYDPDDQFSRAFFAADQLGVLRKTHAALFDAIHKAGSVPMSKPSADELAAFYRQQGVDPARFKAAMTSAGVDASMARARAFIIGTGMTGTPALVVNGKYLVKGRTAEDNLRIADFLITQERTAGARRS